MNVVFKTIHEAELDNHENSIAGGDSMRMSLERIDPETARTWLEEHDLHMQNRRLRDEHIQTLAKAIRRGEWSPERGEPIRFDTDGVLVDGQHRLWAVIEANRLIWNHVLRGVDRVPFRETPEPKKQFSLPDYLYMHGVRREANAAAVLRMIWMFKTHGTFKRLKHHGDVPWSEALAVWEANPELEEMVRLTLTASYRPLVASASLLAAVYWIFREIDANDADDFMKRLGSGVAESDNDPIIVLRNRMIRMKDDMQGGIAQLNMVGAYIIKAWNAYRDGRTISKLQYSASSAYPTPI